MLTFPNALDLRNKTGFGIDTSKLEAFLKNELENSGTLDNYSTAIGLRRDEFVIPWDASAAHMDLVTRVIKKHGFTLKKDAPEKIDGVLLVTFNYTTRSKFESLDDEEVEANLNKLINDCEEFKKNPHQEDSLGFIGEYVFTRRRAAIRFYTEARDKGWAYSTSNENGKINVRLTF